MSKTLKVLACVSLLALGGVGCTLHDTPHKWNPLHWGTHFSKVFGSTTGEFHLLHVDIDRVFFGLEYYDELTTENVYTR